MQDLRPAQVANLGDVSSSSSHNGDNVVEPIDQTAQTPDSGISSTEFDGDSAKGFNTQSCTENGGQGILSIHDHKNSRANSSSAAIPRPLKARIKNVLRIKEPQKDFSLLRQTIPSCELVLLLDVLVLIVSASGQIPTRISQSCCL